MQLFDYRIRLFDTVLGEKRGSGDVEARQEVTPAQSRINLDKLGNILILIHDVKASNISSSQATVVTVILYSTYTAAVGSKPMF